MVAQEINRLSLCLRAALGGPEGGLVDRVLAVAGALDALALDAAEAEALRVPAAIRFPDGAASLPACVARLADFRRPPESEVARRGGWA